jgi:polysaccharide biosynthesis protein PelF
MIDVCLLLEGSYPFVSGGVSTWVHELISTMKDIRFGIVYIAAHSDPTRRFKYEVPNHVVYLKETYLHDYNLIPYRKRDPKPRDYDILQKFTDDLFEKRYDRFSEFMHLFRGEDCCFDTQAFFSSEPIWEMLKVYYRRYGDEMSFIDFFWTWRGTQLPLLQVLSSPLPRARIYHAISTGYAGLLGAIAQITTHNKLLLTEHGIYTHERLLEISQATWIYKKESKHLRVEKALPVLKQWWIGIFEVMSRLTYQHAHHIFTLYEGNKIREILEGASPEKISIIPNGIDLESLSSLPPQEKTRPEIGFIGRVVRIKDVKTYIQAAKLTVETIPDAHFFVCGPTSEESDYYEECQRLVEGLKLESHITFTGRIQVHDYLMRFDVIVLTSLSEAQPYAILEANACGIPVVASDVGACRELVEGKDQLDRAFGVSGLITEVSNPRDTADSIITILQNPDMAQAMGRAGKKRVTTYYDVNDLRSRYLNIYEQNL